MTSCEWPWILKNVINVKKLLLFFRAFLKSRCHGTDVSTETIKGSGSRTDYWVVHTQQLKAADSLHRHATNKDRCLIHGSWWCRAKLLFCLTRLLIFLLYYDSPLPIIHPMMEALLVNLKMALEIALKLCFLFQFLCFLCVKTKLNVQSLCHIDVQRNQ